MDINSDLGESYGAWRMGDDAAMLDIVTSANVACGFHAGDPAGILDTLKAAAERGVAVGAHVAYPDLVGFGRRHMDPSSRELVADVVYQIGALQGLARAAGTQVRYVKPHGALANLAADRRDVADAIAAAVGALPAGLAVLAISGTEMEAASRAAGLPTFAEVFADRAYLPDGRLVPRDRPGAVIHDAGAAADRLLAFLKTGQMPVQGGGSLPLQAASVCIHGDNPAAVAMAGQIRARLLAGGVTLAPFLAP